MQRDWMWHASAAEYRLCMCQAGLAVSVAQASGVHWPTAHAPITGFGRCWPDQPLSLLSSQRWTAALALGLITTLIPDPNVT